MTIFKKPGFAGQSRLVQTLFVVSGLLAGLTSLGGVILMTDVGQLIALPRDWIIAYYQYKAVIIGACVLLFAIFAGIALGKSLWKPVTVVLCGVGVGAGLFAANFMNPIIFPSMHESAEYASIAAIDPRMTAEDSVYVIDIAGDVVGFPQKFMGIPHIAGARIGGQDIAMAYCGLSNVPVAYKDSLGGQKTSLKVFGQTNNNLIMLDENSGEIIQQITGKSEFGSDRLSRVANQMMPWATFKRLFPGARVFNYPGDRVLDDILNAAFEPGLKKHFDPNEGPLFPTLGLDDLRLPMKEQVWGIDLGGEQVAFARSFFDETPVLNTDIGGEPVLIVYFQEEGFVGLFSRRIDNRVIETDEIDAYGNTAHGRLEKLPMHNGVLWMVWSHFFPETGVRS